MRNKIFKILMTLVVAFSSVGGIFNSINVYAKDELFNIDTKVEYKESYTQADIHFDLLSVNERFKVESIKDSKGITLDLEDLTYSVMKNDTYVFEINYYEGSKEELLTYSKEVFISRIKELTVTTPKSEEAAQKTVKTQTNSKGDSLNVQFNRDSGLPVDWSDTHQIDWLYYEEEQIEITANFSEKSTSKIRRIEVNIPEGYEVIAYSAKNGTESQAGEKVLTTTESTQQSMISSQLTSLTGNAFGSEGITGYKNPSSTVFSEKQKSGKIAYEFNTEADLLILTLRLGIDKKLYNYSDTRNLYNDSQGTDLAKTSTGQIFDALEVKMTSGAEVLEEEVKANVKGSFNDKDFYLHRGNQYNGVSETYIEDGKSPEITPFGNAGTNTNDSHIRMINQKSKIISLQDEIVLTYEYPEGATFEGIDETTFMKAGNADIQHFQKVRKVVVTYKNIYRANNIYNYGTPKFTLDGDYFSESDSSKQETAQFSYTLAIKGFEDTTYMIETRSQETKIVDKNKPLEITEHDQFIYNHKSNGYDFSNAYQFLGSYTVENPSAEAKENLNLDWKMDDVIGAKILRCAIPKNSTLSNIKVYTTSNTDGLSLPTMTSENSIYASGTIIDADQIGLAEDEFITRATGTISQYPAGHYSSAVVGYPGSYTNSGYAVYGYLLKDEVGQHTLNIDGIEKSTQITPTDNRTINIFQVNLGDIDDAYYPGDSIPITSKVTTGYSSYGRNKKVTDNFLQDPTIYIRVPKGFALDESSIKFDYLGDVTNKATLTKFEKDGAEIYKYTFDDPYTIMAGYSYRGGEGNYNVAEYLNVSFDLKVSPSNDGYANLAMKDVMMIEGKGKFVAYDTAVVYMREDNFGLTETGYNLVAANETAKTSVVKLPELQVLSGNRIKDSGSDFYNYDGTSASVASLSKDKVAEVEVKYANNSSSDFEKANIYFPIPKAGVDHGICFNNKAITDPIGSAESTPFTWDANLLGEVNAPGFTTKYAIDGEAQKSTAGNDDLSWEAFVPASGWKTYDEVKDHLEEVVFLKFESNSPIAPAVKGSFIFELKADTNSPVDEVNYWRTYTGTQISGKNKQQWVVGGVLAGSLSVGELHGMVFIDKNQNGVYDAGIDDPYTGNDITLNLSESSGAIATTPLAIDSNGCFDIDMLKQGNYTISALNKSHTTQKFTTYKELNNDVLENNAVPSNITHNEARVSDISIKAVESEKYTNIGIGLVEETAISYEFEDKIKGNAELSGQVSLMLGTTTVDYDGVLNSSGFLNHKFAVPTVTLPKGYAHTHWEIYTVESGVENLLKTVAFDKLSDETIPAAMPGQSYLLKAKVSLPPSITTTDLNVYVGNDFNLLSQLSNYVTAFDEENNEITLVLAPGIANTEVIQSIPTHNGKYSEVGTYEVTVKVTTPTGSYKIETLKVLVNKSPVVEATHQEYKLEDDILTGVNSNATALWLKASQTVGEMPTVENITPTYTVTGGPTSDFSQSGLYEVTYTATNSDSAAELGIKKVKVLVLDNDVETDATGELSISAHGFVLENSNATSLDSTVALSKGEAKAYRKTYENNVLSNIEELTNIEVNANQLAAIQSAPKQGGIYELKYAVKENNKEVFKTVNVIVKGVSTSIDNDLVLTASGFSLENAEASSIDQAQAILKGNAKAMLASTGEVVTTVMVDASELQAISQTGENGGIYNLTYTASSGTMQTSVTVKVVVLGVGTPPPVETEDNDRLAISAHGFVLENKDAKFLTENKAKTNSEVYAWLVKAQEEVTDITVDAKQLKSIQTVSDKGGVYDLTLTAQSGAIKNAITIKVFVKPVGSVTDSSDTYTIDANGFVTSYEDSKNINNVKAKELSSSIAYKVIRDTSGVILNIEEVSNEIIVDQTQLSDINNASTSGGIFALAFSVGDQNNVVSIEVPVLIVPKWNQSNGEITIGAEGFVLENKEASILSESLSLSKANAKAYKTIKDTDGNVMSLEELTSSIKVNETELKAIQGATQNGGVYDLTYSVSDQKGVTVSKTVKVIVKGTHTPTPEGGSDQLAMTASDFTIENTEASGLTVEKAIEKSKAEAWLMKEGSLVEIFVDKKELTEIQNTTSKGGVYPLTLRATYEIDGELIETEITIQVTVNSDEGDVLGENMQSQGELNEISKVNNEVIQTSDTTDFFFYIMLLIVSIIGIKVRKAKAS